MNKRRFEPIETATLSWHGALLRSLRFEDVYFSDEGAQAEVRHVFIDGNQLIERWSEMSLDNPSFVVAETGFGMGKNFLQTWSLWQKHAPLEARLHFISCEKHPLTKEDLSACWSLPNQEVLQLLQAYPVLTPGIHQLIFEQGRITLTLMLGDATTCFRQLLVSGEVETENNWRGYAVDAWFLDGFSPAKNPDMWSKALFETMALLSKEGTTVATFSSAGIVKRGLDAVGFQTCKKPGYARKRDMLTAVFKACNSFQTPRKMWKTPWHAAKPVLNKMPKKAIVVGAGLAGCYVSSALARRGWCVTLLDDGAELCQGASGNRQAVLYPNLSPFCSSLTEFTLSAYLYAVRAYQEILNRWPVGDLSGILQLAVHEKERKMQASLAGWLCDYPALGRLVDSAEASRLAGVALTSGGVFIPSSGWLNSFELGQRLIQTPGVTWYPQTDVSSLHEEQGTWHVGSHQACVLVLANGYRANTFEQTSHLPLTPVQGQMTWVASQHDSLRIPLCGNGHVFPAIDGMHAVGATYHPQLMDGQCSNADARENLARLHGFSSELAELKEVVASWVGVRAATPDYLPLVGPVPNEPLFQETFAGLARDANRWVMPSPHAYHQGLYVCTGFGSRGLTSIPLSAECLAAMINQEPSVLPRHLMQSLSPARFLRRQLIRAGSLAI